MQKKLFVPLSLSTKHAPTPNPLLSLMLDRFWRDTRKYLGLGEHEITVTKDRRRDAA